MKVMSYIVSFLLIISSFSFIQLPQADATYETVLLGDVNNSGDVSGIDALCISNFLNGSVSATSRQLTAMDVNEDGVIDKTDVNTVLTKIALSRPFSSSYKELYSVPDNSTVTYCKHDCTSNNSFQKTEYTIQATSSISSVFSSDSFDFQEMIRSDYPDYENINCVRLSYSDGSIGSGFIVDDHIIATAAHCVYNSNGFLSNLTITLFDADMHPFMSISPSYIHVPKNFVSYGNINYDYALIYVDEDLSDYKANVGVMTDYFMTTNQLLTTSGFTFHNNVLQRYYSSGSVTTMDDYINEKPYRFHSYAMCPGGKSGGMVYFESSSQITSSYSINTKSVAGIATSSFPSGSDTFGCRITTSVLRFFYQNNYLN